MFLYNCRLWVHRACDYKRVTCCHPKNSNQWMFPCSFAGCVFVDVGSVSLIWCFCKEKRPRTGDWLQFHYSQGHWFQRGWDSWNWDKEPWELMTPEQSLDSTWKGSVKKSIASKWRKCGPQEMLLIYTQTGPDGIDLPKKRRKRQQTKEKRNSQEWPWSPGGPW